MSLTHSLPCSHQEVLKQRENSMRLVNEEYGERDRLHRETPFEFSGWGDNASCHGTEIPSAAALMLSKSASVKHR